MCMNFKNREDWTPQTNIRDKDNSYLQSSLFRKKQASDDPDLKSIILIDLSNEHVLLSSIHSI